MRFSGKVANNRLALLYGVGVTLLINPESTTGNHFHFNKNITNFRLQPQFVSITTSLALYYFPLF